LDDIEQIKRERLKAEQSQASSIHEEEEEEEYHPLSAIQEMVSMQNKKEQDEKLLASSGSSGPAYSSHSNKKGFRHVIEAEAVAEAEAEAGCGWTPIGQKQVQKRQKIVQTGPQASILSICYCKIDRRSSRNVMESLPDPENGFSD
jgi:hypothetical protein